MTDPILLLKTQLCDVINQSELPIGIKYYIVKDIFDETKTVYSKYIEMQKQEEALQISDEEPHTKTIEYEIDNATNEVINKKEGEE